MADIAASVLTRLKNKAQSSGRSYQLCLQLFCQEEFLRRLEKSKYAENFVLKGGLFIYSLTEFDSRVTVDVDFLLRQMPNTPEQLRVVLEEIIATPSENDFITFEITDVAPIAVAKKYAGIGASLVAHIKNTRTPFSIDFGVGDVIVPKHEKRKIPTQLDDFTSPTVNTYSLETTIAEKLDAILDLMEFSSRMKDYYDIYYLANKFDFDGATLAEALKKTFENREHIISLPINSFFNTPKKTYILTLRKKTEEEIDNEVNQKYKIFCYICKSIGETLDTYRFDTPDDNDLHEAVNKYNSYKNLPDRNDISEPFKSWFANDGKMKLLSLDNFPSDSNWNIDNFWTDQEKIDLGFKEADDIMTLDEFKVFIDTLVNDMTNYKEAIECLKQ